ncbi:unnamed protein product [Arctia plantaginis]|uniref:C-type lectin domain-containing protein n=1 Tax=Arctia plantaginis TaxID=874455 RepID=A0A8S0ZAD1_ARCPL|nr:unnamed protein product [Arctia plantaginis]
MVQYVIFVFTVLLSTVAPDNQSPRVTKRYRSDYVYNYETDAFYKLHIESRRSWQVKDVCKVEGALLMTPNSDHDLVQLHLMLKQYPDLGDYVWVANDGEAHESAEEQPIIDLNPATVRSVRWRIYDDNYCEVATRNGDVETMPCYRNFPFICKVKASDAAYDPRCGAYGKDYKCFDSVRSCYKIPHIVYTWSEAYSECQAEGAHLVVLNSETERAVVQNLTMIETQLKGARASWFFFAGFRADEPPPGQATNATRVFKTVFNQTLEEAGYHTWSDNEPNNALGHEYCGSIFKNDGKLNDIDCTHLYAFICEKEFQET